MHQPWFAGGISRDAAATALQDLADGSFLVRESQSRPGQFTLTVKYIEIRHIMIINQGGLYGFSVPALYRSLPEMIDTFGHETLAQYNAELETSLAHPYKTAPKQAANVAYDEGPDEDIYMSNMAELRAELAQQGAALMSQTYSDATEARLKRKRREVEAQRLVQDLLQDQLELHRTHHEMVSAKERDKLMDNYESLQGLERKAKERSKTVYEEIIRLEKEGALDAAELSRRGTMALPQADATATAPPLLPRATSVSGGSGGGGRADPIPNPEASPFYVGLTPRDQCMAMLEPCPDGAFLVRKSDRPTDPYTLSLRYEGRTRHIQIKTDGSKFGLAEPLVFYSLESLCDYYMEEKISQTIDTTLKFPYKNVARP